MKTPQCNRAFAEVLAASVERKEREHISQNIDDLNLLASWRLQSWERDWGEMRFRDQPLRQPRLHQKGVDSAFIVAIFLATIALILCCVR